MATGVDVRVGGKVVKGVSGYSVKEESTPVDVSDTTGATGQFSVPFFSTATPVIKRMRRKTVVLEDRGRGVTDGIARVPSSSASMVSLSVDSKMSLLAVERTAQPFQGTLGNYFIYLLSLVDITADYFVDPLVADIPATFPGWQGDVWLYMKKMLSAKGIEVSLVSGIMVMRPLRGRVTVDKRDIDFSWSLDDQNLALSVEGYYYNNQYKLGGLAYPEGGWNDDVQVYQVDAGETTEFDIAIGASLVSIVQPVAMDNVTREEVSASVYSVMSNDGYPYSAAQWDAEGGKVTVAINEDTRSLTVTIVGSTNPQYAPFRIAATAGPSDNYSSLRLVGEGVFFDKKLLTFSTTVGQDIASQEVGVTVDNEFISTIDELYDAMIWPLARFGGSRQSITVRTSGINRSGDSGVYSYPTIAEFNAYAAEKGWTTIADFNAFYSADSIAEFNAWWYAQVADSFVNQAFGNVAGARTRRDNIWWRIRQATIEPGSISYTAEADTTVGDFNTEWGSIDGADSALTIADFNGYWSTAAGWGSDTIAAISDLNVAPLERSAA